MDPKTVAEYFTLLAPYWAAYYAKRLTSAELNHILASFRRQLPSLPLAPPHRR